MNAYRLLSYYTACSSSQTHFYTLQHGLCRGNYAYDIRAFALRVCQFAFHLIHLASLEARRAITRIYREKRNKRTLGNRQVVYAQRKLSNALV